MGTVDVVIVSYNSSDYLPRIASSIRSWTDVRAVHVVDNHSGDSSAELAERLQWGAPVYVTRMSSNVGFGRAVNRGAFGGNAQGSHILVLNPDVVLEGTVLQALMSELESDPQRGAIGTKLITSAGQPVSSAREFPNLLSIVRRRPVDVFRENRVINADWLCGALMLWKRTAFEELGGFSEEFFLYFEDVDICMRARRAGWSVAIDGRHTAVHDQGHGVPTSPALRRESRRSRRKYAAKWLGTRGALAAAVADCAEGAAMFARRIRRRK